MATRKRAATAALIAASLLVALPALAQTRQYCQTVSGRVVCGQATGPAASTGNRSYERWDNGAPARSSGASGAYYSNDSAHFPHSFGAYTNLGSFGR